MLYKIAWTVENFHHLKDVYVHLLNLKIIYFLHKNVISLLHFGKNKYIVETDFYTSNFILTYFSFVYKCISWILIPHSFKGFKTHAGI